MDITWNCNNYFSRAIFFINNKEVNLADRENVLEYKDIKIILSILKPLILGKLKLNYTIKYKVGGAHRRF